MQQYQQEEEQLQQIIECDNQDMMQVNLDALQSQTTGADATDADLQLQPPPPPQSIDLIDDEQQLTVQTIETTEANSDSSSLPAIAEDLPNGCSQETKVSNELDAEMVSEDELPAPAQPTIDDAEDLSDDELPGPKRAELPADTEVVSEDELPSSNKVKRKAEEVQEAGNTSESADTPKKRAKTELDSNYFHY